MPHISELSITQGRPGQICAEVSNSAELAAFRRFPGRNTDIDDPRGVDLYKAVFQKDLAQVWLLSSISPIAWTPWSGAGVDPDTLNNAINAALGTTLNGYLKRDGTNAMAANLPMGSHEVTGAADGTTNTSLVTLQQLNAVANNAIQQVASLAAIKALSNSTAPTFIVDTVRGFLWNKQAIGTLTADDDVIIQVTDNSCQYVFTGVCVYAENWKLQAAWYVDANSGSNWNTGASGHAVKSTDEIQRRWGPKPVIPQAVTVTILSNIDHIYLSGYGKDSTCSLTIQGTATAVVTSTIATFASLSHGTYPTVDPTPTTLTITGQSDLTAHVGRRMRSGTLFAFVDLVNPLGGGLGTCSCQPWGSMALTGSMAFTQSNPSVGAQVVIETLTTVESIRIDWFGHEGNSTAHPWLVVRDFDVIYSVNFGNIARGARARIYACHLRSTAYILNSWTQYIPQDPVVQACFVEANMAAFCSSMAGCLTRDAFVTLMGAPGWQNHNYCLMRATTNSKVVTIEVSPTSGGLVNCQLFSSSGVLIGWQALSCFCPQLFINISGKTTVAGAAAVLLRDQAYMQFDPTQAYNLRPGTGGSEIQALGTSALGNGGFSFSDCLNGLVTGEWSGTATIGSSGIGYVDVTPSPTLTAFFTTTADIQYSRQDLSGDAGELSIPASNRSTSTFRIKSQGTGDTSTVCWRITSDQKFRAKVMPTTLV